MTAERKLSYENYLTLADDLSASWKKAKTKSFVSDVKTTIFGKTEPIKELLSKADKAYRSAIKLQPSNPLAYLKLAYFYSICLRYMSARSEQHTDFMNKFLFTLQKGLDLFVNKTYPRTKVVAEQCQLMIFEMAKIINLNIKEKMKKKLSVVHEQEIFYECLYILFEKGEIYNGPTDIKNWHYDIWLEVRSQTEKNIQMLHGRCLLYFTAMILDQLMGLPFPNTTSFSKLRDIFKNEVAKEPKKYARLLQTIYPETQRKIFNLLPLLPREELQQASNQISKIGVHYLPDELEAVRDQIGPIIADYTGDFTERTYNRSELIELFYSIYEKAKAIKPDIFLLPGQQSIWEQFVKKLVDIEEKQQTLISDKPPSPEIRDIEVQIFKNSLAEMLDLIQQSQKEAIEIKEANVASSKKDSTSSASPLSSTPSYSTSSSSSSLSSTPSHSISSSHHPGPDASQDIVTQFSRLLAYFPPLLSVELNKKIMLNEEKEVKYKPRPGGS